MIQSIRIATSGVALAAFTLVAAGAVQGWPLPSSPAVGGKLYTDRLPAVQERDAGARSTRTPRTCSAWPYEGARCVASVTVEERPEPGLSRLVRVPADVSVAQADTAAVVR